MSQSDDAESDSDYSLPGDLPAVRDALISWYEADHRQFPWRETDDAYETGDFTAPDVPTQPSFEGSRRQFRGKVISILKEYDELPLSKLGPRVRVDYAPEGEYGREWLEGLLSDLADDGLVEVQTGDVEKGGTMDVETVARLRK